MSGSLSRVLTVIGQGARSTAEIAARTGLDARTVTDAVEHLVVMGRLEPSSISAGCPAGGCGRCPSHGPGQTGCSSRGLVTFQLTNRS